MWGGEMWFIQLKIDRVWVCVLSCGLFFRTADSLKMYLTIQRHGTLLMPQNAHHRAYVHMYSRLLESIYIILTGASQQRASQWSFRHALKTTPSAATPQHRSSRSCVHRRCDAAVRPKTKMDVRRWCAQCRRHNSLTLQSCWPGDSSSYGTRE